ncbi:MAG: LysM peptidoglycan-binding domain-containing protein [candidate division WOR-3 bacterium]|nr:LysM peptidoglycan-binding domain-containing protein [candidate division WOR-3 bacterium]
MKKIFLLSLIILILGTAVFAQRVHIVKKGDTLWDLAGFYYDNPFLWRKIYNANMDKIDDPHWIYPGQEFLIPDIPADVTMTETEMPEERTPREVIVDKSPKEGDITYDRGDKEETLAQIKRVREDIKKIEKTKSMKISNAVNYAVSKKLAFKAGYITETDPMIGKLGDLYDGSHSYTTNEKAYIQLNDETDDIVGKELIVYQWDNQVNTADGEYLGKHVKIFGTIKVEGIEDNKAYGTIKSAYDVMRKGFRVAYYTPPIIPLNNAYLKENKDIRASLIGKSDTDMRINEFSVVFTDMGKEDMINHGDVFTIIRKNDAGRYYAAGAVQILVPYEGYSTAVVMSIKGNIDIAPVEEMKLAYRNKSAFLLNQYKRVSEMESGLTEEVTEEEIAEEEIMEEEVITEPVITEEEEIELMEEETVITEETIEEVTEEEEEEEETVVEETEVIEEEDAVETEEEVIIEEEETTEDDFIIIEEENTEDEPLIIEDETEDEFIIEEEAVQDTEEDGFIIEEEDGGEDSVIVEGEDEIIIIEE